ncbi:MAG: WYL domain-containing protein [Lachnospiraceae bacterium]|nr:WYL domain-containing protein [Lachnospiraceae bacterium]
MAKSFRQKLKLLYLKDILLRESDEEHPLNAPQLISKLNANGIEAERKSIYSDIEYLADYGLDLLKIDGRDGGYFVGSSDFELAELKLLVDAVQSSHFITEKKSEELIKKLASLTNIYNAEKLKRQVYTVNRIKAQNESVFYAIDDISEAITENKNILFSYMKWDKNKELVPRHEGKKYHVDPIALIWDDEYYYLLGIDLDDNVRKHFRVDKIKGVSIPDDDEKVIRKKDIDIADYSKKIFGMYGGKTESVTIKCPNDKIGIFIDRLGRDISVMSEDDEHVRLHYEVEVSDAFYGWLSSLGDDILILGSEEVRKGYISFLRSRLKGYE